MKSVRERFINYVKINTRSDEESKSCPSSEGQWNLANLLKEELLELGLLLTWTRLSMPPAKMSILKLSILMTGKIFC